MNNKIPYALINPMCIWKFTLFQVTILGFMQFHVVLDRHVCGKIHYPHNIWNSLQGDVIYFTGTLGENMIKYTTNVVISSYIHIFTHKCKKVKLKTFQSLSNHHGAQY
jgi:hypothetical protein